MHLLMTASIHMLVKCELTELSLAYPSDVNALLGG